MGYTHTTEVFIVYLKLTFLWASYILSANPISMRDTLTPGKNLVVFLQLNGARENKCCYHHFPVADVSWEQGLCGDAASLKAQTGKFKSKQCPFCS